MLVAAASLIRQAFALFALPRKMADVFRYGVVMPTVEFWYEFASTYSYPAAMRIARKAREADVTVRWRPFLLGPIFGAQGWNDSPFNIYPAKGRNMWRDLERICQ